MCGFAGFIDWAGLPSEADEWTGRMSDAIRNRGPDDAGCWSDPVAGVAFGHRRLSILDLSPMGHQPMLSGCGRWVIAFNGEIYNHEALRKELESAGWGDGWRGHSDTEVLLAAIAMYGVRGSLEKCVGMFGFALWDRAERTLVMARDRLGEKPVYFGWLGSFFVFASDMAAFYRHPAWKGEINRGALALLMRHNYIPAPYSIFSNISKLQPGRILTLAHGLREPRIESYWNAAEMAERGQAVQFQGSPLEVVDRLEALLRQSLAGQMTADVPLGAFLSGGVDSSTVVALMQSMSSRPIRTFTIGFHEEGYNEAVHAKAVAAYLGTDHTELYVSPREALDVIPQLPVIYSEPFSDSSQIPTFLVSRLARQSVTVSLSGDGGDELFSGYSRYTISERLWSRLSMVPRLARACIAAGIEGLPPRAWSSVLSPILKLAPEKYRFTNPGDKLHKLADVISLRTEEDVYRRLVSHWQSPAELVIGGDEPATMLTGLETLPSLSSFVQRMMYLDMVSYLPDDILVKVDRASMGVSLESRVPLLDHRVVEFAMSLPIAMLRREGQSKWPLRQVLYRHVPRELIERPKMGFGVPIDTWLRGPLRDWGEALLERSRLESEGFFRPDIVRTTWEQHQSGDRNWQYLLWDVLTFQAWHEHYRRGSGMQA